MKELFKGLKVDDTGRCLVEGGLELGFYGKKGEVVYDKPIDEEVDSLADEIEAGCARAMEH